ncbi:MAG TPA: PqqD family protein [Armatimonadota bacterium]|nr:PqqD family protein [Armatimonadota bacterium]
MGFWRRKKQPQLTREQVLHSRPLRNSLLEWTDTADGKVMITIPRREDWVGKMVALLFHVPKTRQLVLDDEVGSSVWRICDGEHTIKDIVEFLCKTYKLTRKEAEVSATEFLRQLGRRRLIGFAVQKSD